MTDNDFVGKYQNALSNLCGVEYPYMQGDPDVDAIAELISVAVIQKAEIERLTIEKENLRCVIEDLSNNTEYAKATATKEYIDRLKSAFDRYGVAHDCYAIVDDVAKERVGE